MKEIIHVEIEITEEGVLVSAQGASWAVLAMEDCIKNAPKRESVIIPDHVDFTE